jgi:hypothetical protein
MIAVKQLVKQLARRIGFWQLRVANRERKAERNR